MRHASALACPGFNVTSCPDARTVATTNDRLARVARDRRGTHAGHIDRRTRRSEAYVASDLGFSSWGGQDLNLRPTDYESAALTN